MNYNTILKKKTILAVLCIFFFGGLLFSQSEETVTISTDTIVNKDKSLRFYQRSGDYYPYATLTEQDTLEWPLEYDLSLDFYDLKGFDVKNEIFTSVLAFTSYSDFLFEWVQPSTGEPWDMTHSEYFQAVLRESELRLVGDAIKEEYILSLIHI